MKRKAVILSIAGLFVAIPLLILVAMSDRFLPERTEQLSEDLPRSNETGADEPMGMGSDAVVVGEGMWSGQAGHSASGRVSLIQVGGEHYLRFEDFEMTSGPMVYLYLTPAAEADTEAEIDDGLRILIDGGADGGEATKRGTFNQLLPAGLDLAKYHGVAAWCDDFNVPFGTAALS